MLSLAPIRKPLISLFLQWLQFLASSHVAKEIKGGLPLQWTNMCCNFRKSTHLRNVQAHLSLFYSCYLSLVPLGKAAVGQRVTVWKLLPKHAFEAEFRDASRSSVHMLADVSRPTSPNPCARQTDRLPSQRLSEMWDFSLRSKAAGFSESLCFDDVFAARLALECHWCFPSWRMWRAI